MAGWLALPVDGKTSQWKTGACSEDCYWFIYFILLWRLQKVNFCAWCFSYLLFWLLKGWEFYSSLFLHRKECDKEVISDKAFNILYLLASSPSISSSEVQKVVCSLFKDQKFASYMSKKVCDVKSKFCTPLLRGDERHPVILLVDEVCVIFSFFSLINLYSTHCMAINYFRNWTYCPLK